jgi:glucose/arabinose dehydrogenase
VPLNSPLRVERLEARDTPANLLPNFSETVIASGIRTASAMAVAPNGDVWVASQGGLLSRFRVGSTSSDAIAALPVDTSEERGLLGIAFDPNYAANKYVYLYRTQRAEGGNPAFNRVSRFVVDDTFPEDYRVQSPEEFILNLDPLTNGNHNGGAIHFGPDGKLYVAVGENGVAANAQNLNNRFGKILRINPDGSIPADNPTTFDGISGSTTGVNRSIWAVGLRNPYTFAFQSGTGRMFINDVGGGNFEEVNEGRAGANYGWPQTEGNLPAGVSGVTYPLSVYSSAGGAAIAGGAFYPTDATLFPTEYSGDYFFADFVKGELYARDSVTGTVSTFADGLDQPVDVQVDANGRLLYLNRGTGEVMAIDYQFANGPITAFGTGPGTPARVVVRNANGSTRFTLSPFGGFAGGVTVAVGELTGDGNEDVVVGAGPGGGPHVKVYDGVTGAEVRSFYAFSPLFSGGVSLAVGNLNADLLNEVVIGAGSGGGPHVKIFSNLGSELVSFFAYDAAFRGGVNVAVADRFGSGWGEIVTGTQSGSSHVKVFRSTDFAVTQSFFAFDLGFTGGVFVTTGDINRDGTDDIIAGAGAGGAPHVRAYLPNNVYSFFAYDVGFRGGVRVGYANDFLFTAAGPGGGPHVKMFDVGDFTPRDQFFPFETTFRGGVSVS